MWADAARTEECLARLRARLEEIRAMATELLPPGLRHVVADHRTPAETLKLIAQLSG